MAFEAPITSMHASREYGMGDAFFSPVEPRVVGWVLLEFKTAVPADELCRACFDGQYPIAIPPEQAKLLNLEEK